ncbi:hypothetical protein Q0590_20280 [Rhodocytophaga aerolata]|uniref:Lipoprotein n=1 Tax=Rhodocytophaga aerolata TaxID=455078 RepID=A0ABT8R964_9BACT|nr:hypothetical protein [Rhodocytophaga aerolata]MDO1448626.1 hypothetical protein [Rhodocytophaga aerolata]
MNKFVKARAAFVTLVALSTTNFGLSFRKIVTFLKPFSFSPISYRLTPVSLAITFVMLVSCQNSGTKTEDKIAITEQEVAVVDSSTLASRAATAKVDSVKKDTLATLAKKDTLAKVYPIDTASSKPVKWPEMPEPLPGSILPHNRIIAFYGNPLSRLMGILGELPPDQMLSRLDEEIEAWKKADPTTPIMPALHVIMVTAQGAPGRDSKYRLRMTDKVAEDVIAWAAKRNAIVFIDIQVGHSDLQAELPRFAHLLARPNVHLGVDAEFAMKDGAVPGKKMGSFDAADLNFASTFLANLVDQHQIPPKVFIVHRFTQKMITNYDQIKLDPRVQIVMHMDGWGAPTLKKDTYRRYIVKEPVQYTGFKIFYKNDIRNGSRLMKPEEVLALNPKPLYIQYQ